MNMKKKVMILDDNKDFIEILKNYINSKTDFEVVCYDYDGKNANKLIEEFKPDIMLLDIVMPEKDGLNVLEDMQKITNVKLPAVVVMSAIGQEKITQAAISLGALYYVVKPFDISKLVERLAKLVDENEEQELRITKSTILDVKNVQKDTVEAKVTEIDWEKKKIALSIRALLPVEEVEAATEEVEAPATEEAAEEVATEE